MHQLISFIIGEQWYGIEVSYTTRGKKRLKSMRRLSREIGDYEMEHNLTDGLCD